MSITYRITVQVVENGEPGELVDIIECERPTPLQSGQNVFHLCREIEADIARESEENS